MSARRRGQAAFAACDLEAISATRRVRKDSGGLCVGDHPVSVSIRTWSHRAFPEPRSNPLKIKGFLTTA
ncbi:hypothetical protein LMG23994_02736 [Cupriavidus pinatubonensis]|uniref:Uncharacterized protein n=1 Tax=Cupriavidus pinatubonensis TaxID=248026 RepID=A0ABM8X203_9BURK|nr:hypothetical protein LMG23994_02736 [Cupriavidus pinatubonensis]